MENFFLGLLSGAMLMLLRDLPALIWKQPKVFWHVFIPVGGQGMAFAIFLVVFGSIYRVTDSDQPAAWMGKIMLGIGIPLGIIILMTLAIALLVEYAKGGGGEASSDTANPIRILVKYQPQYRTASNRPKR